MTQHPTRGGAVPQRETYVGLLRHEWNEIEEELLRIIEGSSIRYVDPNTLDSNIIIIGATGSVWAEDAPEVVERRRLLRIRYSGWIERFRLLFGTAIPTTTEAINNADTFFVDWVERARRIDYSIPRTISEAKDVAKDKLSAFTRLLDQVENNQASGTCILPDTNALLTQPDFRRYGDIDEHGTILFIPQVMRELDELKDRGRTPELRDAATKVIRRIKGLRDRGNILHGVPVEGQLTAQAVGTEPDFARLPDSLDPNVPDDRIIGAILEYQATHPNHVIVFITGDISAQIKAQLHGVPYAEVPR